MKAVLFDLLSALLDSWSLWDDIAGGRAAGRTWRTEYLRRTYATGAYVPYRDLVADSAEAVGLPPTLAAELEARWDELVPWPRAGTVLRELARERPLGVATNCSEVLGRRAAALVGAPFRSVVTAESAGFYKPDPRIYLAGVDGLGRGGGGPQAVGGDAQAVGVDDVLFVAGSPLDIRGAARAGLTVVWHNPARLSGGGAEKLALHVIHDLRELPAILALKGSAH